MLSKVTDIEVVVATEVAVSIGEVDETFGILVLLNNSFSLLLLLYSELSLQPTTHRLTIMMNKNIEYFTIILF